MGKSVILTLMIGLGLASSTIADDEVILMKTNFGPMVFEKTQMGTQIGSAFEDWISGDLYNQIPFLFLEKGYYIQSGQMSDKENYSESIAARIESFREFDNQDWTHERGTLSLTPLSDGSVSQAFTLLLGEASHLDQEQSIVAQMVLGEATLKRIEGVSTDDQNRPDVPLIIEEMRLESKEVATQIYKQEGAAFIESPPQMDFLLIVMGTLLVISFIAFALYSKLNRRSLIAVVMLQGLIATFGAFVLIMPRIEFFPSWGGLLVFAFMLLIFKFMNRFESQAS